MNYAKKYEDKPSDYYAHSRPELLKFIPSGVHDVLDIGCSSGNFGKLLKTALGCTVWGIEPDKNSAEEASQKLDYVINDIFNQPIAEKINKKFDCIFFNDVIEHLYDPEEALSLC